MILRYEKIIRYDHSHLFLYSYRDLSSQYSPLITTFSLFCNNTNTNTCFLCYHICINRFSFLFPDVNGIVDIIIRN